MNLSKIFHIKGLKKYVSIFLINKVFLGTNIRYFEITTKLIQAFHMLVK